VLLRGALGGVIALLGVTKNTVANTKRRHPHHTPRKPPAQRRRGDVQISGKGKGKSKGKGKRKPHKKPPSPPASPQPGPLPQLCDVLCADEGGRCCHGECIDPSMCCYPEEKTCADGSCVAANACCSPEERDCGGGVCVPRNQCCSSEKPCQGGCVPAETCCPTDPYPECDRCDQVVCKNGSWVCDNHHECPSGGTWNPERCRCEYCEVICNANTHMCQSIGCKDGEWCTDGFCGTACTENPSLPQLCCAEDLTGQVLCYCTGASNICFWCHSGVCACSPGESCCDPDVNGPFCPTECHCPS
jgi:hypothetical protein